MEDCFYHICENVDDFATVVSLLQVCRSINSLYNNPSYISNIVRRWRKRLEVENGLGPHINFPVTEYPGVFGQLQMKAFNRRLSSIEGTELPKTSQEFLQLWATERYDTPVCTSYHGYVLCLASCIQRDDFGQFAKLFTARKIKRIDSNDLVYLARLMIKHERRRIFLYAINKKDFLITDITDDIIESDQDRWLEILVDEGICPKRLLFLSMEKESSLKCFEMLIGRMDFYKLDFIEIIRACGKSVLFTKHFLYAFRLFWEENDIPPRKLNKLIIYISKYRTRTIRTILDDKDERSILHILTPYQREILINKREFFRL